jgi:DNA-binding PadR family transcriptional regulator
MEKDGSAVQDQALEDLTLLLIYLTSWEEKVYGDLTVHRAWKGYLFEVLDRLEEAGYLNQTRRAKSVTLTEAGLEHARALEAKFLDSSAEGR